MRKEHGQNPGHKEIEERIKKMEESRMSDEQKEMRKEMDKKMAGYRKEAQAERKAEEKRLLALDPKDRPIKVSHKLTTRVMTNDEYFKYLTQMRQKGYVNTEVPQSSIPGKKVKYERYTHFENIRDITATESYTEQMDLARMRGDEELFNAVKKIALDDPDVWHDKVRYDTYTDDSIEARNERKKEETDEESE